MSGEAVVITAMATSPIGLGVLAAVAAGTIAAAMLHEQRKRAEERAIAQQRDEIQRVHQRKDQEKLASKTMELNQRCEQTLLQLAAFELHDTLMPTVAEKDQPTSAAEGFLALHQQHGQLLNELHTVFESLPASLRTLAGSPFPRLQTRLQSMQRQHHEGTPLLDETLDTFRIMLDNTIRLQIQQLEESQRVEQALHQRLEQLLLDVVTCKYLAIDDPVCGELDALQQHVLHLLEQDQLRITSLDVLEKKFQQLKSVVDTAVDRRALHASLQSRMRSHLEEMRYQFIGESDDGRTHWNIPGGERVAIALQQDLRIGFQLQHERASFIFGQK